MILVIGGAGYIGSHVCMQLSEANEQFVVFDNFETGHRQAVSGMEVVEGDLRNRNDLEKTFEKFSIESVMHFGAYIMVGESVQNPAKYYENNFVGVKNLLDVMLTHGVSQLIFSSTAAIFGQPEYVPIDEEHPKNPTSPYGDSKLAVERMLDAYGVAYGLRSVCLRYFNAAGSDPGGRLGEDHDPESHLIPAAILACMRRTPPLTVFGTDYETMDGTCIRDYIHVCDLAAAHLRAVSHLNNGGASKKFNLGNGEGFSVRQVLQTVSDVSGIPVPAIDGPRRAGDPAVLVASSENIRREWGWEPRYSHLETIVKHAWDWRSANPEGYGDS